MACGCSVVDEQNASSSRIARGTAESGAPWGARRPPTAASAAHCRLDKFCETAFLSVQFRCPLHSDAAMRQSARQHAQQKLSSNLTNVLTKKIILRRASGVRH